MNDTEYPDCTRDHYENRQYYKFVVLSVAIWATCFMLILIPRIFVFLCTRPEKKKETNLKNRTVDQVLVEPSFYSSVQNWAEDLISGNTTTGRILVVFAFVCSILSFVIYIIGKYSLHCYCNYYRYFELVLQLGLDLVCFRNKRFMLGETQLALINYLLSLTT